VEESIPRRASAQRKRLWCVFELAISAVLVTTVSAQSPRPNVVLIVADDLGAMDLGCYGSKYHRTPALDTLAADGVRFTQAYAACPVCSPTRAAIMTGKYPARLHLTDWLPGRRDLPGQQLARPEFRQQLPLEEVTLAELFRDAGYVTGHIGKWHLGGTGFSPLEQGFGSNIGGDDTGTPLSYFAPFSKNGRVMPGLNEAAAGEYLTDRFAAEAERFLTANRDRPFLLYLPHNAVHTPLQAPSELVNQFPEAGQFTGQQNNPVYAAMLLALDNAVGRVRAKLKELVIAERTWIVFTSDNGGLATTEGPKTPATSNSPLREGKGWLYEGGVRVPLLIAGPTVANSGRTSDGVVSSYDLFHTLAGLCGIPVSHAVDGVDFESLLTNSGALRVRPLYWHYPHYSNQGGRPGGAIREGNWKLVEFYENGRRELFDVVADPREGKNLSADQPEVVERLGKQLAAWREEVGAQAMTPNSGYRPNLQLQNGRIELPAKTATVHGVMLRYEPLPHKNTLGYWVRPDDWAHWEFEATRTGTYRVEALVGCGNGSGGSVVEFTVAGQKFSLTVEVTGGFQNFVTRDLGIVTLEQPGRYEVTVKPQSKPGPAVMDLRQMTLIPVAK
jgi:arylsulfatase A